MREKNVLYRLKRQVYGLHTDLELYTGLHKIQILSQILTIREELNQKVDSETSEVHTLSSYIEAETKNGYLEQMSMEYLVQKTCTNIRHALLSRLLTEEVFKEAHECVTSGTQA